jgi:hypothetical protein
MSTTKDGVHYSIQSITPKDAEQMLGHNRRNRNVVQRKVREYAKAIRRGDWLLTGDPIRFGKDGTLLDGQHRLLAVVEAGKGIQTMVIRNVPDEVQDAVDTGVKRTLAHVLQIKGYPNANVLAAAVRGLYAYREAGLFDLRGIDNAGHQQLLALLHRNNGLQESVRTTSNITADSGVRYFSAMAALHYVISEKHDEDTATAFFDNLCEHSYGGSGKKDPIIQLRKRLMQAQAKTGHGTAKMSVRMKAALTVKAFNYWMQGVEPELLQWRAGGPSPEAFPQIISADDAS